MNYSDMIRAFDATMSRESRPNYEKSFKCWQKNAIVTRRAFSMVTEIYEKERNRILTEYSTSKASEMLTELQDNYLKARRAVEDDLKKELDTVIQSKRDCLKRSCRAPTTEDANLLAVLNMRSKITDNDLIHAAEAVGNNLLCLGTLSDIADRHGIFLPIPTAAKYEEQLDQAEQYANERISEVLTPEKDLPYKSMEFYNYPDAETGFAAEAFSELDNSVFTSVQTNEPPKIDMKALRDAIKQKHEEKSEAGVDE